jgi:ATP-dependent Clp protease ATP-binding subunit ClpC
MMHGYNLTERLQKVLAMAREEATRLHHEYVGTEHLLLGLIRERKGVAANVLARLNVDPDELRRQIDKIVKPGRATSHPGPDLPYTSRAKQVLELAMMQMRDLGHSYAGTEHLLLGLLAEGKGIAAQVLGSAGVHRDVAKAEVNAILGTELPGQELSPHPPTTYEQPGAPRGKAIERVDLILAYEDGSQFTVSFRDADELRGFLAWVAASGG